MDRVRGEIDGGKEKEGRWTSGGHADENESSDFIRGTNQEIISSSLDSPPGFAYTRTVAPARGLVKLNRCVRSLKLYVVARHPRIPTYYPKIFARATNRGR